MRERPLLAVLALSAALNVLGLTWGLPSPLGWAADELTPVRVLAGMREHFAGGWHDPYPPFHFYVLAAAYAPVLAVDSRPLADLASSETGWRRRRGDGAVLALFLGGRLVSLLMALGTIVAVYHCGLLLFDRTSAAAAALTVALSLPFVYYAKIANVDLPLTFWFALALLAYVRLLRAPRLRDYLLFAAAATLAVCAKDQAFALFALPALHLARRGRGRDRGAAVLVAVAVFLVAEGIVFNPSGFLSHLEVLTGPMNRDLQMFPRSAAGLLGMLGLTAKLLVFTLGLPATVAGVAGLWLAVRTRRAALLPVVLPCLSYLLFFLCVALVGYDRYLMPVVVCLSLPAGYFLAGGHGALRRPLAAAVLVWGLARVLAVDLALVRDARYAAEAWMAANVPPGATVAVTGPLTHLPRLHGYDWTQRASLGAAIAGRPSFVVLTVDYAREASPGTGLGGDTSYAIAYRHRTPAPWPLDLGWWISGLEAHTNLHKVNPEVIVLRKAGS